MAGLFKAYDIRHADGGALGGGCVGLYVLYFHLRRSEWKRFAGWAHLQVFLALLTTFFLVNLLPKLGSLLRGYV